MSHRYEAMRTRLELLAILLFWRTRFVAVALVVPVAALAVGSMEECGTDKQLQLASAVLQLFGLLLVARGLEHIAELFGKDTLGKQLVGWFRSVWTCLTVPVMKGRSVRKLEIGGTAMGSARTFGNLTISPSTLDQRVQALELGLDSVRRHQSEFERTSAELSARLERRLDDITEESTLRVSQVERRLDTLVAASLKGQLIGVTWLVLGAVYSGIAEHLHGIARLTCIPWPWAI